MEIRYQLPTAEYAALQKKISRRIYKGNKLVRRLRIYDMALFLPYLVLVILTRHHIRNLQEMLGDCYEPNYSSWLGWLLVIGSYFIFVYATIFRPIFVNKIFREQVKEDLTGCEQVVRIQEDGLYLQNALVRSVFFYTKVRAVENIDNCLVIFLGSGHFQAIPYNAFADEDQRMAFEHLLKSKMIQNERLSG